MKGGGGALGKRGKSSLVIDGSKLEIFLFSDVNELEFRDSIKTGNGERKAKQVMVEAE